MRAQRFHVVANEARIEPARLSSVTAEELVNTVENEATRYSLMITIQEEIAEKPPEEAVVAAVEVAPSSPPPAKKRVIKYDALRAEYEPDVKALNFDGIFVGNLLEESPGDPRIIPFLPQKMVNELLMKANKLLRDGSCQDALEIYGALAQANPDNTDYQLLYGRALLFVGQYAKGIAALKELAALGHEIAGPMIGRIQRFRDSFGVYPKARELDNLLRGLEPV